MILRQGALFLINGSIAVLISFIIYTTLMFALNISLIWANLIGCLSALLYGFIAHKITTFQSKENYSVKLILKYFLLYSITIPSHIVINWNLVNFFEYNIQLAYVIATLVTALINFIALKFIIFTKT